MPAYVVINMTIHDPETYRKYTSHTPPIVKRHGGRYLTRGDAVSTLEGETFTERMVILEFPSKADVEAMFKDPDYVAVVKYRHAASVARVLVQEGGMNTENPEPKV
ncbi:hypothetical protein EDB81DRAFT_831561 [Dactylonectria macrodidyma]|uniref:DUF1330 domain-containing protein n=1 Tax=Dactylonectria macrodidyma TaxID=307937 RepID=A0A9P9I8E0_9HYPO|nr:hypothetical protein EDB81DRAFT_831561 [Dactylonectria macrodidyma]